MYIPFENLPKHTRVWIYQTNRQLTDNEVIKVEEYLKPLLSNWAAHGSSLLASVKVFHNRFVVIGLDENQNMASGCSIDASTRWLKELGDELNVDFFDRQQAYLDGDEIKTFSVFQAKKTVESGIISPDAVIFVNNNIRNLGDMFSSWKSKATETYLKRYFSGQAV